MAHTKQQSTLESEFKKALEMNRTLYEQNCRLNNETALVKEAENNYVQNAV